MNRYLIVIASAFGFFISPLFEQLEAAAYAKNDRAVQVGTVMEFGRAYPSAGSFSLGLERKVRFSKSPRILSDQLAWFPQVGHLFDPNTLSIIGGAESESESLYAPAVGYSEATSNKWTLVLDLLSSQLQGRSVARLQVDSLGETPLEMFAHVDGAAFVSNGTVLLVSGKLSGDESYSLVGLSPISGEVEFVFPREGLKSYFVESRSNRVVGLFKDEGSYEVRMYRAEDGSLMNSMKLDSDITSVLEIALRETAEFPLISYGLELDRIDLEFGQYIALSNRLAAIDLEGQRLLGRTELTDSSFFVSSDSRFIAFSDKNSPKVEVWNVSENSILFEVENESDEPFAGFAADLGQFLMYDSNAREIDRWNLRSGESLPSIPLSGEDVIHLSVDELGGRLFVISLGGLMEVVDLESGSVRGRIKLPSSRYKSVIPFAENSLFVESENNALLKVELAEPIRYTIVAMDQFDQCFRIGPEKDWLMSNSGGTSLGRNYSSPLLFAQVVDRETSFVSGSFDIGFYPAGYFPDSDEGVTIGSFPYAYRREQRAELLDASSKDRKLLAASGNEDQLFVDLIDLSSEEGVIRLEPPAQSTGMSEDGIDYLQLIWGSGQNSAMQDWMNAWGVTSLSPLLGLNQDVPYPMGRFIEKLDRVVISNGQVLQFFDASDGSFLFTSKLKSQFSGSVIQLEASENSQKVAVVSNYRENRGFSDSLLGSTIETAWGIESTITRSITYYSDSSGGLDEWNPQLGTELESSVGAGGILEIHDALGEATLYPEFGDELVRSVCFSADGGLLYVLTGQSIYSYQLSNGLIEKKLSVQSVNGWDRIDVSPSGRYAILSGANYPLWDSFFLGGGNYSEIAVVDFESRSVGSALSDGPFGRVYFSDEVEGRFSMFHSMRSISEWEIESGTPVPIRLETNAEGNPQIVLQAEKDVEFLLSKSGDLFSWEDVSLLNLVEGEAHIPIEWDDGSPLFYRVWKYLVADPN